MKKQLLKSALMAVVGVGLLAGSAMAFSITFSDGSTTKTVSDNGAGDALSTTGKINIIDMVIGNWEVSGVFSTSSSQTVNANPLNLDVTNYTIKNIGNTSATLTATISDIFYTTGSTAYNTFLTSFASSKDTFTKTTFQTIINGTYSSLPYQTGPGQPVPNFSDVISTPNLSTVTVDEIITLTGIKGETALYNADTSSSPVPEPATMLLFGTGIVGLAGIARRRKAN